MPENLQAVTNKETHKLLEKYIKDQQCLQNITGCEFNTNSNKNVFLTEIVMQQLWHLIKRYNC